MKPRSKEKVLTLAFCLYAITTLVSMAIMNIGVGILIGALLWSLGSWSALQKAFKGLLQDYWTRMFFWGSVILTLACLISLVIADIHPIVILGYSVKVDLLRDLLKCWYLFLPFILLMGLRQLSEENRKLILKTWLVAAGVFALFGISQYFYGWSWMRSRVIPSLDPNRFHVDLWLGHHLSVASILIFPFFASVDLFWKKASCRNLGIPRPLVGVLVALGCAALVLTYSRIIWISLLLGLLIYFFIALPRKWAWAMALTAVVGAVLVSQHPDVNKRIRKTSGWIDRKLLWKGNYFYFKNRPLTGVGFRKTQEMSEHYIRYNDPKVTWIFSGHAHNNVIEMLGGTGLLGTLAWIFWVGCSGVLVLAAIRGQPQYGLAVGMLVAWLVFHMNGMTQVNFWEGKVQHQMMWSLGWILLWKKT